MASEASETAEHTAEDEGQTASSQPSQAPTAAEPRNTTNEHRRNDDDGKSSTAAVCSRKNWYGRKKGWRDDVAQLGPGGQRTLLGPLHFGASWPVDL